MSMTENRIEINELYRELKKVNRILKGLYHDIDHGRFDNYSIWWKRRDILDLTKIRNEIDDEIKGLYK